ncbi:MAG: hypothetical protein WD040_07365, partial [Anaerolineales bacterium]
MTFDRMVRTTVWAAVFAMALRVSVDTDTWWHLRAGQTIAQEQRVLLIDRFSLTRSGAEWHYPGWLAEVFLDRVFAAGGLAGLNLATAGLVLVTFVVVWFSAKGPPLLRGFVILLAATASAVYWAARPHIFTLLLTAAVAWLCGRALAGRRQDLYWCIPVMAVWGNLHGGFAAGLLLLILAFAGELIDLVLPVLSSRRVKPDPVEVRAILLAWGGAILGCFVAISLNPLGPELILYPIRTVSIGVLQEYIQEWQSPNFHHPEVLPFLALWMVTFVVMTISPRRARSYEILWIVVFGGLAFLAGRNIALFAVISAPVLAIHGHALLAKLRLQRARGRQLSAPLARIVNIGLLVLVFLGVAVKAILPLSEEFNRQALRKIVPVDASAFLLSERPGGPLFNTYNWGGYVVWRLYPHYLSFVDGRTDLFGDEILQEYLQAWRADPGWPEILARWGIRVAFQEPNAPHAPPHNQAGWEPAN